MRAIKLLKLRADGKLESALSPRVTVWDGPMLRAHMFEPGSLVANAPGIHGLRYGFGSISYDPTWVVATCEVPPGTHAVASPWAIRAERMLMTELRFAPESQWTGDLRQYIEATIDYWRPHINIAIGHRSPNFHQYVDVDGLPAIFSYADGLVAYQSPMSLTVRMERPTWGLMLRMQLQTKGEWKGYCCRMHFGRENQIWKTPENAGQDDARYWRRILAHLSGMDGLLAEILAPWRGYLAACDLGVVMLGEERQP